MDVLILNQQPNSTLGSCHQPYARVYSLLNNVLLFSSFPTSVTAIVKVLLRMSETRSLTPAAVFLLQIGFTNVGLFVSHLLLVLDAVEVGRFSETVFLIFFSPSLTARPLFIFASCVLFYVAIVHPVTYRTAGTLRHWEWLVVALIWFFALSVNLAIILWRINIFQPGFLITFYATILPSLFLYVTMLRTLSSGGTGSGGRPGTLNPAKRKAFQIILSILLNTLLYYVPSCCTTYFLVYLYIAPTDWRRFLCSEALVIMLLLKISEFLLPIILLYSLYNVGV